MLPFLLFFVATVFAANKEYDAGQPQPRRQNPTQPLPRHGEDKSHENESVPGHMQITPAPLQDITPVPSEKFNPHVSEFRRMDSNNDETVTFTEFLLSDKHYIEVQSRNFHKLDQNHDGVVSRAEYEGFYKKIDDARRDRDLERESFFKDMPHRDDMPQRHRGPFMFGNDELFDLHHDGLGRHMPDMMRGRDLSSTELPINSSTGK